MLNPLEGGKHTSVKKLTLAAESHRGKLPEDTMELIDSLTDGGQGVGIVAEFPKLAWARSDEMPSDLLILASEMAITATQEAHDSFDQTDEDADMKRGELLATALLSASKAKKPKGGWPKVEVAKHSKYARPPVVDENAEPDPLVDTEAAA